MITIRSWAAMTLSLGLTLAACAAGPNAGAPPSASPSAAAAPCGPADCAPCDETKGKCTGPTVCDGHPEKARRVCARAADGSCQSQLGCE